MTKHCGKYSNLKSKNIKSKNLMYVLEGLFVFFFLNVFWQIKGKKENHA
jgi:hypothetical protein